MITGNENLQHLVSSNKQLISIFEKYGLSRYLMAENLKKIGKYTRLNSVLATNNIEKEPFLKALNEQVEKEIEHQISDLVSDQHKLHFAAMLPCGLRNPFKTFIESFILDHPKDFKGLNYLIEGNVNHELSYYPLLDTITDVNELPDIMMASDVNNFFHRPFVERFIQKGVFETYTPFTPNAYLEQSHFADTGGNFTMFTSNMLVMVIDTKRLGQRKMPEYWDDLLMPEFENDIIMRGEDDFFCNAVMLPFFKDRGFEAIKILAKNIKGGLHPAEMVKLAAKNSPDGATAYIMPYFFAKRIISKTSVIVWPKDGAIVSPVFLLVKKDKIEKHKMLLDFLLSKATGNMLAERYFPSIHPEVSHKEFPTRTKWLGWDFLNSNDIGELKEQIRKVFMSVYDKKIKG